MPSTSHQTILATDLDGTFLGGDAQQRRALYDWITAHRNEIILIFVTGRGLGFIRELCDSQLPLRPDHVVANVGTTAVTGPDLAPLEPVESWIESRWPSDAPERIAGILARHDHLQAQPVVEGRRVSCFYTDPLRAREARGEIESHGFDVLLSDNLYFDVLPRGVRKGPTLLRMLDALGLPRNRTLVAGDTLNDLSLFETGLAGVAVANSEPALLDAIAHLRHIHHSPRVGAAGVLDALQSFHGRETP